MGKDTRSAMSHIGAPQIITMECGHSAIFHVAPPKKGDLISCYIHAQGSVVVKKERVRRASPYTSRSRKNRKKGATSEKESNLQH